MSRFRGQSRATGPHPGVRNYPLRVSSEDQSSERPPRTQVNTGNEVVKSNDPWHLARRGRTAGFSNGAVVFHAHIRRSGTALATAVAVGALWTCINTPTRRSCISRQSAIPGNDIKPSRDCFVQMGFPGVLTAEVRPVGAVVAADPGAALAVAEARAARGTCRR
jgi:hypothetical protein